MGASPPTGIQFGDTITVVDRTAETGPATFGREELFDAIREAGGSVEPIPHLITSESEVCIVLGKVTDQLVRKLCTEVEYENRPEGVIFQWEQTPAGFALVVAGTDERGLQYGLLELAERIRMSGLDALDTVEPIAEFPDHDVRGIDRYMMGPIDDEWFYSIDFWEYYLSRLAHSRFNRLAIIFGLYSSYMCPPYPFFVDVEGYPNVEVPG